MSRPHQLWMYVGKDDKSRVSSADLSDEELPDEVRRLTCFNQKDNIVLTSARLPYDLKHLPAEVIFIALAPIVVLTLSFDLLLTSLSANGLLPLLNVILLHPKVGSNDDDEVPLAKRAKLFSRKAESAKESNPSPADPTPPSRTTVAKIPVSKVIPLLAPPFLQLPVIILLAWSQRTLIQLRKTIKTSADQVLEANKLTADAQNENILLKDDLKKMKKKMKDEQDARREAAIAADEKEGALRESITNCLNATDVTINRARKLQED
ncbi:hypothetical protein QYE76_012525 [Lolium multiflorum]|uniref:Uncharacterized protein n=1 Tax=Lolium multiflorum TaxID=4521 RepID=A0AAD8U0S4_LOLMU|nr:hypothetical protein QYE76_012525 [Lolium multiflorum]